MHFGPLNPNIIKVMHQIPLCLDHFYHIISFPTGYKYELALVLNGTVPVPDFSALEYQVFRQYRSSRLPTSPLRTLPSITAPAFPLPRTLANSLQMSPRSKRDWSTKTHFNYLLLDPSQLGQLGPGEKDSTEQFRTFVEAVFYVGKGKNARSLQHLKDAKEKTHLHKSKVQYCIVHSLYCAFSGEEETRSSVLTSSLCLPPAVCQASSHPLRLAVGTGNHLSAPLPPHHSRGSLLPGGLHDRRHRYASLCV